MEKIRGLAKDLLPLIVAIITGIMAITKVSSQVDTNTKWIEKTDPVIAQHTESIIRADERYKNIEQSLVDIKKMIRDKR